MRKIKLDLDALQIETFDTLPDERAVLAGTVRGHETVATCPTDEYAQCATAAVSNCCTDGADVGCSYAPQCGNTGDPGCNGSFASFRCPTAAATCTWEPQLVCGTNPIAYPTICNECPLTAYNC